MKKKDFIARSGKSDDEKEITEFINMMEEEMAKANITGFMNGVMTTAQAMSSNMGYSSLAISVSLSDRYLKDFTQDTGKKEEPEVYEADTTLAEELGIIFDGPDIEPDIGGRVAELLERVAGENPTIVRFENEAEEREAASGYNKGWSPFYFVEDLFFVVFEDLTMLIILGNDE